MLNNNLTDYGNQYITFKKQQQAFTAFLSKSWLYNYLYLILSEKLQFKKPHKCWKWKELYQLTNIYLYQLTNIYMYIT